VAAPSATVVKELLPREGELTRREEALSVREEKARISKKACAQVSASLDEEWTKAEADQQGYLNKMAEHTTHSKQVLDFNKMLGEKRARLDEWEWDLELRTTAMAEAQAWGINL
jgi:peptide deformylase